MIIEEELNKLNQLVREKKALKEFISELSGSDSMSLEVVDDSRKGITFVGSLKLSQYEGAKLINKRAIEAAEERIKQIDEEFEKYELRCVEGSKL